MFRRKRQLAQELEETRQKKSLITKCSSGKKGNAARQNIDLNSSSVSLSSRKIYTFYKFVLRDANLLCTFLPRV